MSTRVEKERSKKMSSNEVWLKVPDFPDYEVSNLGSIRRWAVDLRSHRLTWQALKAVPNKAGYLSVSLCRNAKAKNVRVNRIVCSAFHGEAPTRKHHAAHENGNRADNRAVNLSWKTPLENEFDKRVHGTAAIGSRHWSVLKPERRAKGSDHGLAKLNEKDIPRIRSDGRAAAVIAQEYGVHKSSIRNVLSGKTWRHI